MWLLENLKITYVACILFLSDSAGIQGIRGRQFGLIVRKEFLIIGRAQRREAGAPHHEKKGGETEAKDLYSGPPSGIAALGAGLDQVSAHPSDA